MIVVVSGFATAGKDTIADHLVERHGFRKTFMSKPLHQALLTLDPQVKITPAEREMLANNLRIKDDAGSLYVKYSMLTAVLGYDNAKRIADYRRLLQRMGTEVGRDMFGENIWLDKVVDECMDNAAEAANTVVTGVRFPNELRRFRGVATAPRGRTEAWYVTRPGVEPAQGHSGETALGEQDFDSVFQNNLGIEDLHAKVDQHMLTRG